MSYKKSKKSSILIALILAFVLSIILVIYISYHAVRIEILLNRIGLAGPLVSILLYAILSASPIPSDPLSLINGAVFGPIMGTVVSWIGNMVAAFIEYVIGTKLSSLAKFNHNHHKKLPFGLEKFPAHSIWFLFLGRFIPEFGGKIVSVIGGFYRVPLWRYTWTAAIATFLGSALFALSGFGLTKLL